MQHKKTFLVLPTILGTMFTGAPSWAAAADDSGGASNFKEIRAREVGNEAGAEGADASTGRSPIDGVKGHLGVGYFTGFAPIGVRYWVDSNTAYDVGINLGFSSAGLESYDVAFEAGIVNALTHYHYSVVFMRAGLGVGVNDTLGEHSTSAEYDLFLNAFLGAELFLGALGFPNISLQGGLGFQASWVTAGGTQFVFGTANAGLSVLGAGVLGFHIYL